MTTLRPILTSKAALTPRATGRTYWDILRANLFSSFNIILFSVGVILVVFGRYNDAFITVSAGLAGTVVNAFQEIRAKQQLAQIMLITRPTAHVLRDGHEETIDATQLTKGDQICLRSGDQALADGVVVSADGTGYSVAEVDEALLTGESNPVRKQPGDKILSGSFCLNGDLIYCAEAVGEESFANKLTAAARTFTPVSTPLQQQVALVIRLLMVLTVIMAFVFYSGESVRKLNFLQNIKASAVLIGLIPYGLFLTINLAYTLGAIRIARAGALVQQTNSVEALHYVDVLCMDKTGTLTTNALQLQTIQPIGSISEATLKRYLGDYAHSVTSGNATIAAIRKGTEGQPCTPVDEIPFISAQKWSALAFNTPEKQGVFVLGALETLQAYLTPADISTKLSKQAQTWSEQGLRVLLFAHNPDVVTLHKAGTPQLPSLQPLGLISLCDELRPHAGEMLHEFTRLGVRLKIISGDNPYTVAALAKQIGMKDAKLAAGPELAQMSAAEFEQTAEEATIFGRIAPEQKAQLVEALLQRGHYVAMIGDGVNDILALKKAKLGIAMQSGSPAVRNVADMILLHDSYAALLPALAEGKRIINGINNATTLLITRAVTYAFAIIGVLMVGLDFPFEPAQAGVTAITVGLPSFFLTLWARPDAKQEPLFKAMVRFVLPVSLWTMLIGVNLYSFTYARASAFVEHNADLRPELIARFEQYTGVTQQGSAQFVQLAARIDAQTTLSVFLSLCALLLLLFLEPPVPWLACWRPVTLDRRPVWLAFGLIIIFIAGLYIPVVATYLGFLPPFAATWRILLIGLAVWFLGLWVFWHNRWLDRLLALND